MRPHPMVPYPPGDRPGPLADQALAAAARAVSHGRLPRLALCGPGRSGKDEAGLWLAANTPLRNGGSTSVHLCPYVVSLRHDVAVEDVLAGKHQDLFALEYARRHEDRALWYRLGRALRAADPLFLVRKALAAGDLLIGCREPVELVRARAEGLVDAIVWIDRDVPPDPTMDYGIEVADLVVPNRGTLPEYHARLAALCRLARIPMYTPARGGDIHPPGAPHPDAAPPGPAPAHGATA